MPLEKFNRSRAQEVRVHIDNMELQLESLTAQLRNAKKELQERCPHPDDYVKKLTEVKQTGTRKPLEIWVCDLCKGTQSVKGEG